MELAHFIHSKVVLNEWLKGFVLERQHLDQLIGQRRDIVARLVAVLPPLSLRGQTSHEQFIDSLCQQVYEGFADRDAPPRFALGQKLYQQLHYDFAHEGIVDFGEQLLFAARPVIADFGYLAGLILFEDTLAHTTAVQDRSALASQRDGLIRQVSKELRHTDQGSEDDFDLTALQGGFDELVVDWVSTAYPNAIVHQLAFLQLFIGRLIVAHTLPDDQWRRLLVVLDHWLYRQSGEMEHSLADTLDVLHAAVPRFAFIAALVDGGLEPIAQRSPAAAEWLLLNVLLDALPDTPLEDDLNAHFAPRAFAAAVKLTAGEVTELVEAAGEALRGRFERAQLDWLFQAGERLSRLLHFATAAHSLVTQSEAPRQKLVARLAEGVATGPAIQRCVRALAGVLVAACDALALHRKPTAAKALLRRKLTLGLDVKADEVLWRQGAQIALALRQIEVDKPWDALVEALDPLLAHLDEVVADNLQHPLDSGSFDDLAELADGAPGRRLVDWQGTLVGLVAQRRLRGHPGGLRRALRAYGARLYGQSPGVAPQPLLSGFRHLGQQLKGRPSLQRQHHALTQFQAALPDLVVSHQLLYKLATVVKQSEIYAQEALHRTLEAEDGAEDGGEVGDTGDRRALNDTFALANAATLRLLARRGINPALAAASFSSQWGQRVGFLLRFLPRSELVANLQGLHQALGYNLEAGAASACQGLLTDAHRDVLGVVDDAPEATDGTLPWPWCPTPTTNDRWRRLAGEGRPASPLIEPFDQWLKGHVNDHHVALPLKTFLEQLSQHGDEELAWQRVIPALELVLNHTTAGALERKWLLVIHVVFEQLPEGISGYWTTALLRGLQLIRQLALGRQINHQGRALATALQRQLMTLASPERPLDDAPRLMGQWVEHLGETLSSRVPSLAALDLARFAVERLVPCLGLEAHQWRTLFQALPGALRPTLDRAERLALFQWVAQLDALAPGLGGLQALGDNLFASDDFAFADTQRQEQQWRDAVGGLVGAAITPDTAPVPGRLVAQRLTLASPVLAEFTADPWAHHQDALTEAFGGLLDAALRRQWVAACDHLGRALDREEQLTGRRQLDGYSVFQLALDGGPGLTAWRLSTWARRRDGLDELALSRTDALGLGPDHRPSPATLDAVTALYQSALQVEVNALTLPRRHWLDRTPTPGLTPEQRRACQLLVRQLALADLHGASAWGAPPGLTALWLALGDDDGQELLPRTLKALAGALKQQLGNDHPLTVQLRQMSQTLLGQDLGLRLLDQAEAMAQRMSPPGGEDPRDDAVLALRRLGLQLCYPGGIEGHGTPESTPESTLKWFQTRGLSLSSTDAAALKGALLRRQGTTQAIASEATP
ncbi:MAG: hypothetical protein ACFCBW_20430 [Candidatus Competibacterales bacterium]